MASEKQHFPIFVEFWPRSWAHGHMVLLATEQEDSQAAMREILANAEEFAEELASAILNCNEERHGGRGAVHSHDDARDAFKAAMDQIMTRDFAVIWADQEYKERMFAKWGGHMPAAVLSFHPDDPKQETLMVPDKNGNPVFYNVPKGKRVLGEFMDRPREGKNAVKHPSGLGWMTKLQWKRRQ